MRLSGLVALAVATLTPSVGARAQTQSLELTFIPTDRAQIAVWVEREDGRFMGTLALTYAVGKMGIGNRPGALQFNSGFRWPYGRREGVLPVWAHRRAAAPGARQWKRVIFQNRIEGHASRGAVSDQSPDHYFCLSFTSEKSGKNALDAVTCASVFSSDKGRYINDADVAGGYAEPFEDAPNVGRSRPLGLESLYPPRRDVERCTEGECYDHADVSDFRAHASAVMPELDAITRATPQGARAAQWLFGLPAEWPRDARYKLLIEVNVEGDYNEVYNDQSYPTPRTPASAWDFYAFEYGYPYRGQPSVVYELPFSLASSEIVTAKAPLGYGAFQGEDGSLTPLDARISNDPVSRQGSGADRLLLQDGVRARLRVLGTNPSQCTPTGAPGAVQELKIAPVSEKRYAHTWARLSFKSPPSAYPVSAYLVEIKPDDGDFEQAFTPDSNEVLLPVALDMCGDPSDPSKNRCVTMASGTPLEATISGLRELSHYTVRVAARDGTCGALGPSVQADFTTPKQIFSTVSPCFIATAAYGSPLAAQIGVLRALRDRQLANHALGRALIRAYYALGPTLAAPVARHAWLAWGVRTLFSPLIAVARWWNQL